MTPYRERAPAPKAPQDDPFEERVLLAVVASVGALRVGLALARREAWGSGVTLCALVAAVALAGLVNTWRRRPP